MLMDLLNIVEFVSLCERI